jgi:hypothetical protein
MLTCINDVIIYGNIFSGALNILKRDKLTKAVFGSKLLFLSNSKNTVKETEATTNGTHPQIKDDNVYNKDSLIKLLISFVLILSINF